VRTIVCFGDSNTHGASATDQTRLARDTRWPGVLRAELGPDFEVIEEGLNGRTAVAPDPLGDDRSAGAYLQPCLWSHEPVDLVIVMLGTNDLKGVYRLAADQIARGVGHLVDVARRSLAGPDGTPPAVLVICPPPLAAPTMPDAELWGFGASIEESRRLAPFYQLMAERSGVAFIDAGTVVSTSRMDGVHLDPEAHAALGQAVAAKVREILG
jgi:lysophospholipase L1-like esterase